MRPYRFFRLTEWPDVADIREEGRHSRVGRNDQKSYNRNSKAKAATRRRLKRSNKMKDREQE